MGRRRNWPHLRKTSSWEQKFSIALNLANVEIKKEIIVEDVELSLAIWSLLHHAKMESGVL